MTRCTSNKKYEFKNLKIHQYLVAAYKIIGDGFVLKELSNIIKCKLLHEHLTTIDNWCNKKILILNVHREKSTLMKCYYFT